VLLKYHGFPVPGFGFQMKVVFFGMLDKNREKEG
jgi:hypothetical protein